MIRDAPSLRVTSCLLTVMVMSVSEDVSTVAEPDPTKDELPPIHTHLERCTDADALLNRCRSSRRVLATTPAVSITVNTAVPPNRTRTKTLSLELSSEK